MTLVSLAPRLALTILILLSVAWGFRSYNARRGDVSFGRSELKMQSYLDELNIFKAAEKKCLVGFTTDAWNIGQRKYKDFLAVHKMVKKIQKLNVACVDVSPKIY
jgi:hypothetical protein